MSKNKKGPQFIRFLNPIIKVLKDNGGSLPASEVADRVIEMENIYRILQKMNLK